MCYELLCVRKDICAENRWWWQTLVLTPAHMLLCSDYTVLTFRQAYCQHICLKKFKTLSPVMIPRNIRQVWVNGIMHYQLDRHFSMSVGNSSRFSTIYHPNIRQIWVKGIMCLLSIRQPFHYVCGKQFNIQCHLPSSIKFDWRALYAYYRFDRHWQKTSVDQTWKSFRKM